ncbi:glycoside hydrolase family 3 N-terminal domain-containing protein [Cytophagales bacterium LB-30]|uniref:beta-glucosidase n=1 Tax=Shiella aurantiaca TaxID=3058365 RepID=A0ABT8F814_9BACT|nr:glycoside hydrolase family 3 N-terminal domain-containing protein [Shiella aurantiaca]MDN4166633.1 glycoside hydrolase family 3 N-terminal domain-containing protein [Shiella aurantiaca]
MKKLLVWALPLVVVACGQPTKTPSASSLDQRVDSLLSLMTLEEKVGQLTLYTSDYDVTGPTMRAQYKEDIKSGKVGAIFNAVGADYTRNLQKMAVEETRLGIPLLFGYDVVHGHQTIFPIPLGESCTWDLEAMKLSAQIAAKEAAAQGLHWTFAPMVDISRDPRWGRVMEGGGEDHYLGSLIAKAKVEGFQGENLQDTHTILSCIKHYAAYGAPQAGREYHTVDMSDRVLREVYLLPYKAGIDAGAATVMTSFNEVDGVPATGSKYLMNDILRKEWGFNGFVVTDYTAIMELLHHGYAADTAHAAQLAIEAGVDMDMQAGFYQDKLVELVKSGRVSESLIDESVRRILRQKFMLGLFEDPYRYSDTAREQAWLMSAEHLEAARDISRKSIVLLENKNNTLPLSSAIQRIALIGPLADSKRDMIGAWSAAGDGNKAVSLREGLMARYPKATIAYAQGCAIDSPDKSGFSEALQVAKNSEVVILALGEAAQMSGEAASRTSIQLPGAQQALMDELRKLGKPLIVVLSNGRPLDLSTLSQQADALVETWFLGTMAGHAIADVLSGDYNPSGKLTMTFPRNLGQIPIHYNMKNTGRPRDVDPNGKYTSRYLDVENSPLYPFGYGLSYTQFSYSNMQLDKESATAKDTLRVQLTVKNTGSRQGEEIVQLYVRDWVGSVTRPVKELKGFQKISLAAGEEKTVVFTLPISDLSFYRQDMSFGTEPGGYEVYVGRNAEDVQGLRFQLLE